MIIRTILFLVVVTVLFIPVFRLIKFISRKFNAVLNSDANKETLKKINDEKQEFIKNIDEKELSIKQELKELKNIKKEI